MATSTGLPPSIAASASRPKAGPAVQMLTIYLALLLGVPSAQTITVLGSLGAPATVWGLVCFAYWAWTRTRTRDTKNQRPPIQPVRIAYLAFASTVWLSFAFAQGRGLPPDEYGASTSALVKTLSWAGVLLLANDELRTTAQLRTIARRIVLICGFFALLGLAQFVTGQALIDQIQVPGLSIPDLESTGVSQRSGFNRPGATATHPLEYAAVLAGAFPLSIAMALAERGRGILRTWWLPGVIGMACLLSSSRSAILGVAVGLAVMVPVLSWRYRIALLCASGAATVFVYLAVPGMLNSLQGLILGGPDASTASRTNALSAAAEVIPQHLLIGRGFGTFLPKYYILDNALVLMLIDIGVLGLIAFLALVATAVVQAQRARKLAPDPELGLLAHALAAGVAAGVALFAVFDAYSFGMAAGTFFLLIGLCGGAFNVIRASSGAAELIGGAATPRAAR